MFQRRPDLNRTLNVVYITHPHPDHTKGIKGMVRAGRYNIGHIVVDSEGSGAGIDEQNALTNFGDQNLIPVARIKTSQLKSNRGLWSRYIDPLNCGSAGNPDFTVLWGSYTGRPKWSRSEANNENNQSLAVRVRFGESSFLITGDMEETAIASMLKLYAGSRTALDVDVYVAGHHGSRNGTTAELVKAIRPEFAIVSAGDPSDREPGFAAYGFAHPNAQAIGQLSDSEYGVTMVRPTVRVAVGISGRNPRTGAEPKFEERDLSKARFSTGWDGDVVVIARSDGTKAVLID